MVRFLFSALLFLLAVSYSSARELFIKFGSEYAELSINDQNRTEHITNYGRLLYRQIVGFKNGRLVFDLEAERLLKIHPENVTSPFYELGKQYEPQNMTETTTTFASTKQQDLSLKTLLSNELASLLLRRYKLIADKFTSQNTTECVLIIDTFLSHKERSSLVDAAFLAGFINVRFVDNIVALALQYGLSNNITNEKVTFFDFGASRLRVGFVRFIESNSEKMKFDVEMIYGNKFSGNKLNDLIVELLLKKIHDKHPTVSLSSPRNKQMLLTEAERIKIELDNEIITNTKIVQGNDTILDDSVTRADYDEIVKSHMPNIISEAFKAASWLVKNDTIVLTGRSSRSPVFKTLLQEQFPNATIIYLSEGQSFAVAKSERKKKKITGMFDHVLLTESPDIAFPLFKDKHGKETKISAPFRSDGKKHIIDQRYEIVSNNCYSHAELVFQLIDKDDQKIKNVTINAVLSLDDKFKIKVNDVSSDSTARVQISSSVNELTCDPIESNFTRVLDMKERIRLLIPKNDLQTDFSKATLESLSALVKNITDLVIFPDSETKARIDMLCGEDEIVEFQDISDNARKLIKYINDNNVTEEINDYFIADHHWKAKSMLEIILHRQRELRFAPSLCYRLLKNLNDTMNVLFEDAYLYVEMTEQEYLKFLFDTVEEQKELTFIVDTLLSDNRTISIDSEIPLVVVERKIEIAQKRLNDIVSRPFREIFRREMNKNRENAVKSWKRKNSNRSVKAG